MKFMLPPADKAANSVSGVCPLKQKFESTTEQILLSVN